VLHVSAVHEVTDELEQAVGRLLPQLSRSAPPLSRDELAEVVGGEATTLLVARDDALEGADLTAVEGGAGLKAGVGPASGPGTDNPEGPIVGMLTLATFRLPTGVRAWVEDVVVDTNLRGRGIGEALTKAAVDVAASAGARTVDLTSRPSREAANRLYLRVGFELRETNVYRFSLDR
jgi:ribosomal protein S18 acetylase RimI-like enzyme